MANGTPDPWGPQRRWPRRLAAGVVALFSVTTAVLWAIILLSECEPPRPPPPAPSSPAPTSIATAATVDPRMATLQLADLPPGYHVLRQGTAAFASMTTPAPASWDVVFAPDASSGAQYLLVESLIAIYPDAGTASAALEAEDAAERAAHAVQQAATSGLGDRQSVWIEPAPDRPRYGIVRVTWQYRTTVEQLSVLGPLGPSQPGQALQLATVQQGHVST